MPKTITTRIFQLRHKAIKSLHISPILSETSLFSSSEVYAVTKYAKPGSNSFIYILWNIYLFTSFLILFYNQWNRVILE